MSVIVIIVWWNRNFETEFDIKARTIIWLGDNWLGIGSRTRRLVIKAFSRSRTIIAE